MDFSILFSLLSFKHITNNSTEPDIHSKLEDNIPRLAALSATLEILFLLSLSEICISSKSWSSSFVFLLFLFFTIFFEFFSIRAFRSLLLFQLVLQLFFFFCLCLLIIARKSLQLSVVSLHFYVGCSTFSLIGACQCILHQTLQH